MFGGREPAVFFAGIGQVIAAIIPALIMFDVINWTDKQTAGFMFVIGATVRFLTALFTRAEVTPTFIANQQIQEGINSPKNTTVKEVIEAVEEKKDAEILQMD